MHVIRWLKRPFRFIKNRLFIPWAEWQEARTYQQAWDERQAKEEKTGLPAI